MVRKWQSLVVKGTSSTQSSPARRQKLDEDLYAVDFVAKHPITAKYVRLVVTQPITNKWLRLSEILVNTQYFAQQFAPAVVDNQQNGQPQLVDGQGRTPLKNVSGNQVNYKIDDFFRPKSLSIYWDAASWEGAAPQLSIVENGNTIALAPLSTGVTQVDLANHPKATQLIVQWEGKNVHKFTKSKPLSMTMRLQHSLPSVSWCSNLNSNKARSTICKDVCAAPMAVRSDFLLESTLSTDSASKCCNNTKESTD